MSDNNEQVYSPGEIVPESGIYECTCPQHHEYSTDVRGHRFPPTPCSGSSWKLKEATHTG